MLVQALIGTPLWSSGIRGRDRGVFIEGSKPVLIRGGVHIDPLRRKPDQLAGSSVLIEGGNKSVFIYGDVHIDPLRNDPDQLAMPKLESDTEPVIFNTEQC